MQYVLVSRKIVLHESHVGVRDSFCRLIFHVFDHEHPGKNIIFEDTAVHFENPAVQWYALSRFRNRPGSLPKSCSTLSLISAVRWKRHRKRART